MLFSNKSFASTEVDSHQVQKNDAMTLKQAIDAYADLDYQKAYQLFVPLAKSGNVYAQFGLAQLYEQGLHGSENAFKAFYWYQKAANQEYGIAQNHLGVMHEEGRAVVTNLDTAKYWFTLACENRCTLGCKNLERIEALLN